jgi:hypothetical protein
MVWGVSASHIPVLTLLGQQYNIEKVLEIGSGELSTPLFLNKKIYPRLETLISVEDNSVWVDKIKSLVQKDDRIEFRPTVPAALYDYDLIFVDGPQDKEKRIKTIHYITREIISPIIVIHDMDVKDYAKAVNKIFYSFNFSAISPWTTVFSKDVLPVSKFKNVNRKIKTNFNNIEEDAEKWLGVLK